MLSNKTNVLLSNMHAEVTEMSFSAILYLFNKVTVYFNSALSSVFSSSFSMTMVPKESASFSEVLSQPHDIKFRIVRFDCFDRADNIL